jgi:hypothetical protein
MDEISRQLFVRLLAASVAPGNVSAGTPALIPQPKKLRLTGGTCAGDARPRVVIDPKLAVAESAEAYRLAVSEKDVVLAGRSQVALTAGMRTLAQLSADGPMPCCEIEDAPDVAFRAAHICYHLVRENLAYNTPNFEALLAHIDELAALKYNALLLELESLFPFRRNPLVSCKLAFTRAQVERIRERAGKHRMEIVPLVQCLGHAYNVLMHDEYAEYREVPGCSQQYCPTHPRLTDLYMQFVEDYRELFPGLRQWHMGGDESYLLGQCDRCRTKAEKQGVSKVYVDYIGSLADRLKAVGLRPMVWSDMLEHHPEAVDALPKHLKIVYWNYHLPTWPRKYAVDKFRAQGFDVVAAPAVRYGGYSEMSIYYPTALEGIETLIRRAHQDGCTEMMVTNWIKGSPYENCHYGFAWAAEICWNTDARRDDFNRRYAKAAFGCDDASLVDVYDLLSNKVLPYGEPVLAHQPININRYDNTGFRFGEKWLHYTTPEHRPQDAATLFVGFLRQFYKNQRCWEPEVLEQLRAALSKSGKAEEILARLGPGCTRGRRQLDLLAMCAHSISVKCRFALAQHEGRRLLLAPTDKAAINAWLGEWLGHSEAWREAKRRHRAALAPTGFAPCVELLNELWFDAAEHDFFVETRMRLRKKLAAA